MFSKLKEKLKSWTKKLTEKAEKIEETPEKELKVPMKFEPGLQKYEPDLEKLQEKIEEIKEETREIKKEIKEKELEKKIEIIEKKEEEKPGFFKKLVSKISKVKISEKEFEVYEEELKMLLLENNVAFEVVEKIIERLKEEIVGKEFLKKEIEDEIKDTLKIIIEEVIIEPFNIIDKIKGKSQDQVREPFVILFCGINGTGKTTTIAKIASHMKKNKLKVILAAADTFRAASIEQLKKHAEKIDVKVVSHDYGSDPAAVGFDAIKYAKKNFMDVVLIDTAGRMHTSKNLLKEMEKISRVCKPDLKLFIGESITGNDSIEQAKSFDWAIGIDGIVLTKADVDEKGGTALSLGYVTKKPILYLGTGQDYDDIEVFDKKKFVKELGL